MSTFDGTATAQHYGLPDETDRAQQTTPTATTPSALDMLKESLEQRDASGEQPTLENGGLVDVEVPGVPLRLLCRTEISYGEQIEWQRASMPKNQRGGRKAPSIWDLDAVMNALLVLRNTCAHVEARNAAGQWAPVLGSDGRPLSVTDSELMSTFNMIDPNSFLRKLFGGTKGEAALIVASRRVMTAAGWGQSDDNEDPTG